MAKQKELVVEKLKKKKSGSSLEEMEKGAEGVGKGQLWQLTPKGYLRPYDTTLII